MSDHVFYGPDQALIHDHDFGTISRLAAQDLLRLLEEAGLRAGTVVDLGCGPGRLAYQVSEAGYDVFGVDISPAMLELAAKNAPHATLLCSSLWDAALPKAVAVTATGEALNYGTDPKAGMAQFGQLVQRVYRALVPGGVFLFDVATPGREGPTGVHQQFHDRERWTLYMRAEEHGLQADRSITIFRKTDNGCYLRTDEHHVLRLYDPLRLAEVLSATGFQSEVLDDYTAPNPPPFGGWKVLLGRKPL